MEMMVRIRKKKKEGSSGVSLEILLKFDSKKKETAETVKL